MLFDVYQWTLPSRPKNRRLPLGLRSGGWQVDASLRQFSHVFPAFWKFSDAWKKLRLPREAAALGRVGAPEAFS